jgi:hypothetical protein
MRRILIGGMALVLCGIVAARSKSDPLVFVFLRVDTAQDLAILRPMIPPDLGVQLDSGVRTLKIVEGQVGEVRELLLDCGEQKFSVKTLEFSPRAK